MTTYFIPITFLWTGNTIMNLIDCIFVIMELLFYWHLTANKPINVLMWNTLHGLRAVKKTGDVIWQTVIWQKTIFDKAVKNLLSRVTCELINEGWRVSHAKIRKKYIPAEWSAKTKDLHQEQGWSHQKNSILAICLLFFYTLLSLLCDMCIQNLKGHWHG